MLKADNITKTYEGGKKIVLQDFSLTIPKGSIYGLLGPNGAGKTSFIRIINQIIKPDSGTLSLNGEKLGLHHIKEIGYMPEERGLYKNMSIGDQLLYFGELKGMSRQEVRNQAKYWFERLGMELWWDKKLSNLSKGMAQKVQFVVTVLHLPRLLILDEPFSGFDPVNANLIKDQILDLKAQGTTIILSTHRMESVEELCDSVALVHQSKKLLDGTISEVKTKFKQDLYEVVLTDFNTEKYNSFKEKFNLRNENSQSDFITFDLENTFSQTELLQALTEVGKIQLFKEKTPSMNDIFIAAVQSNEFEN